MTIVRVAKVAYMSHQELFMSCDRKLAVQGQDSEIHQCEYTMMWLLSEAWYIV